MSEEKDRAFEDSDDSDDEDYVLGGDDNLPSEEESDGEPEDDLVADGGSKPGHKRKTHQKKGGNKKAKLRKNHHNTAVEDDNLGEISQEQTKLSEEDEKKKTDLLWSDFLKDTKSSAKPQQASNETDSKSSKEKDTKTESEIVGKKENKVTITKVFEFAGEEVKVTKEVPADSLEAQIAASQDQPTAAPCGGGQGRGMNIPFRGSRRPTGGGLSAVLGQIGKKNKIGTLEKSKIDWDNFKKSQGLEEDIQVHNRGKDGYLEKQDFLQRADIRQFEIEKEMRKTRRSNR